MEILKFNINTKGKYRPAIETLDISEPCKDLEFALLTKSNRIIFDLIGDISCEYYDQEYASLIKKTMSPDFANFIMKSTDINGIPNVDENLVFIQILQEAEMYYCSEHLYHYIGLIASNAFREYFQYNKIVFDETKYNPHDIIDCICNHLDNLEIDCSKPARCVLDNLLEKLEKNFKITITKENI